MDGTVGEQLNVALNGNLSPGVLEMNHSKSILCFHQAFQKCGWLVALLIAAIQLPVVGAEEKGTAGSDKSAPVTLQGGVVKVEVTLNDLRDARLSSSRVRKAAANLYDEVTRQQVTMNYNPNLVGTTVITIPTPTFTGQYLPPRRKWVAAAMAEIGPIMNLFKEDVETAIESDRRTNVSEATREVLDPLRDDVFALVKSSFSTYQELEKLTGGSGYDSNAIASAAKGLDNQMKQLDRSLKKGISTLQKEAKSSKKSKA